VPKGGEGHSHWQSRSYFRIGHTSGWALPVSPLSSSTTTVLRLRLRVTGSVGLAANGTCKNEDLSASIDRLFSISTDICAGEKPRLEIES
jgi:hypothetical protein